MQDFALPLVKLYRESLRLYDEAAKITEDCCKLHEERYITRDRVAKLAAWIPPQIAVQLQEVGERSHSRADSCRHSESETERIDGLIDNSGPSVLLLVTEDVVRITSAGAIHGLEGGL